MTQPDPVFKRANLRYPEDTRLTLLVSSGPAVNHCIKFAPARFSSKYSTSLLAHALLSNPRAQQMSPPLIRRWWSLSNLD